MNGRKRRQQRELNKREQYPDYVALLTPSTRQTRKWPCLADLPEVFFEQFNKLPLTEVL